MQIKTWVKNPARHLEFVRFDDIRSFSVQHDTSAHKYRVIASLKIETQSGIVKNGIQLCEFNSADKAEAWLTDLLGNDVSDFSQEEPKDKGKK